MNRSIKAHAFGNDFLLVDALRRLGRTPIRPALARDVCDRHRGIGADGLIVYAADATAGASMQLLNADGSRSEVSGNGVRCLAAWLASTQELEDGASIDIETDAGVEGARAARIDGDGRYTFRAAMGQPGADRSRRRIDVGGRARRRPSRCASATRSASCSARSPRSGCTRSAAALAVHPHFPEGTNVELATVEAPDRVRILIWERGVGPTEASGTGACAAAVAAIAVRRRRARRRGRVARAAPSASSGTTTGCS